MCLFLSFLFQNIDSDSLEQKQTNAPGNLPAKVSHKKSQKSRTDLWQKQTFNYKALFQDFFTHLPRMAGFKKFTPALPQALGFNLPLKKAGGFCDHPSLRVEFKLRKTSESCSKQTSF